MTGRRLCDGEMWLAVDGSGDRTLVVVGDGTAMRFWTDTANLEGVLRGLPFQIEAFGGLCVFTLQDGMVNVVVDKEGDPRRSCSFSASDFAEALAEVRGRNRLQSE